MEIGGCYKKYILWIDEADAAVQTAGRDKGVTERCLFVDKFSELRMFNDPESEFDTISNRALMKVNVTATSHATGLRCDDETIKRSRFIHVIILHFFLLF